MKFESSPNIGIKTNFSKATRKKDFVETDKRGDQTENVC